MPGFLMPADSPCFTASGDSSHASNAIGQLHPLHIKPETIGKSDSALLSFAASNITKYCQYFQKHCAYSL